MRIDYKPQFEKMLAKLPRDMIVLTKEVTELFRENPYHPSLRNHVLHIPLERFRTISVHDDLRILFRVIDDETVIFYEIGTHKDIYGS